MNIEDFITLIAKRYEGRIPFEAFSLDRLENTWISLEDDICRCNGTSRSLYSLLEETRSVLEGLRRRSIAYADFSRIVERYDASLPISPGLLELNLERFVLALHDRYVLDGNLEKDEMQVPMRVNANGCRQCGACCIGPAEGPISTSPPDIALWESLERDDLPYYTLPVAGNTSKRAHSLHFEACPFLRFPETSRGLCLVHPVKPLICREFICGDLDLK